MTISLNGKNITLQKSLSLQDFLEGQGLAASQTAVAINQEIIRRDDYKETLLKDGDKILLIGAAKGG